MPRFLRPGRITAVFIVVVLLLAVWVWMSDFVTLQGERTIYTAACIGGEWKGDTCNGRLVPGERYRFRALRAHREVLFWTAGATAERVGRFSQCDIHDGRNWSCSPSPEGAGSITLQMEHGRAVHDPLGRTRPFHAIEKWRWMLLRWGLPAGRQADY
jgi:hypothetical protein